MRACVSAPVCWSEVVVENFGETEDAGEKKGLTRVPFLLILRPVLFKVWSTDQCWSVNHLPPMCN